MICVSKLDAPNFGIGSKEFTTDFEVPYKRYIKTLAVLLNFANVSASTIDHDIHNVYDFERKLVSLMSDVASRKDHFNSYYKMTIGSMQKYFKNVSIHSLLDRSRAKQLSNSCFQKKAFYHYNYN